MPELFQVDKLHIREFRLIKGQIDSPFEFDKEMVDGFHFEVGFEMSFDIENKLIKADFQASIETKPTEGYDQKATGYFEFAYIFEAENMNDLVIKKEDGGIMVDGALANAISTISYSTSRGVLLTRFQGTALANFILPVFDPKKLITSGQ
jgi:hypothetical protein